MVHKPPIRAQMLAEGEGFEPPEACTSTVFKTAAIVRSATPPSQNCIDQLIGQHRPISGTAS